MSEVVIRDIEEKDFEEVVRINQSEVVNLSPMDIGRLKELISYSDYYKVAEIDSQIAGFILVMGEKKPYTNDNYSWFSQRYSKFLYIDRIAISSKYAGRKIGSRIYEDLFKFARNRKLNHLACEINVIPPNEPSINFHRKYGFKEIGEQWLNNHSKMVSMQILEIE